jgi:hypothetical protein
VSGGPGSATVSADSFVASTTNCDALGNALVIQDTDVTGIVQNGVRGSITFAFDPPMYQVDMVGLLDMVPVPVSSGQPIDQVSVTMFDDSKLDVTFVGLGSNTAQNVSLAGAMFVKEITLTFHRSGAITFVEFQHCPERNPPVLSAAGRSADMKKPHKATPSHHDMASARKDDRHHALNLDPVPAVAETKFVKDLQCSKGFWGEHNVKILPGDSSSDAVDEGTDVRAVKFRFMQPFQGLDLAKVGVWFDSVKTTSQHDCHLLNVVPSKATTESFAAKCGTNGYAIVNLYGGEASSFAFNQIGVESEVPEANCPSSISFPEYNPLKRCFWQFKLKCETAEKSPTSLNGSNNRNLVRDHEAKVLPRGSLLSATAAAASVSFVSTINQQDSSVIDQEPFVSSLCEQESKLTDVTTIPSKNTCTDAATPNSAPPIQIESQDGTTVTFTLSQVWKGCDINHDDQDGHIKGDANLIDWIAVDYEAAAAVQADGSSSLLQCTKKKSIPCGPILSTVKAACTDGVTVVDVYTHDAVVWNQQQQYSTKNDAADSSRSSNGNFLIDTDSRIDIPAACGVQQEQLETSSCHYTFLLKCIPSKCVQQQQQETHHAQRIGRSSSLSPRAWLGSIL